MSNFYLCDMCRHFEADIGMLDSGVKVFCQVLGATAKRAMVDHGRARGRSPYDEPRDVCESFDRREGA